MRRTEGHFRGSGQIELFFQGWWQEKAQGNLIVTHGYAEHSECYDVFARRFNNPDWNILAWDLRGHGRSEGKRGLVRSFDEYVLDLVAFVKHVQQTSPLKPIVLLGHSMGGLITLKTVMDHDLPVQAIALSSPLLGISMKVPPLKDLASKLLANYLPQLTLHNPMAYEHLSRDPEMIQGYGKDPLRHERISPNLYLGMLSTMDYVMTHAHKMKLPMLMQISGHDLIVSQNASEEFYQKVDFADKALYVYADSYHEIFNDLDYKEVMDHLNPYLSRFLVNK